MSPFVLRLIVADVTEAEDSSACAVTTGALSVHAEARNARAHIPAANSNLIVLFILNCLIGCYQCTNLRPTRYRTARPDNTTAIQDMFFQKLNFVKSVNNIYFCVANLGNSILKQLRLLKNYTKCLIFNVLYK